MVYDYVTMKNLTHFIIVFNQKVRQKQMTSNLKT